MAKIRVSVQQTRYGYVEVDAPDTVLDPSLSARKRQNIAKRAAQQALESGTAPVWTVDPDEFGSSDVWVGGAFCEVKDAIPKERINCKFCTHCGQKTSEDAEACGLCEDWDMFELDPESSAENVCN